MKICKPLLRRQMVGATPQINFLKGFTEKQKKIEVQHNKLTGEIK